MSDLTRHRENFYREAIVYVSLQLRNVKVIVMRPRVIEMTRRDEHFLATFFAIGVFFYKSKASS